jgi:N-acetylglucosamine-6-phosphate deacetylase
MSLAERMAARETARVARVETAVEMASLTPANSAGLGDTHGSLEPRKRADIVLLDADLFPVRTLVGGETVWEARG